MVTSSTDARAGADEAGDAPCLEEGGARVYAETVDGVLVVRVYPGRDGPPVAVKVDDYPVAGTGAEMRPRGRHRRTSG